VVKYRIYGLATTTGPEDVGRFKTQSNAKLNCIIDYGNLVRRKNI
jgi:hypothetical protein